MDWKRKFSSTILSRGRSYFRSGRVKKLIQISDNEFTAKVKGSYVYNVNVIFRGDNTIELYCTCPYGSNCKHQAAVLFAIDEQFGTESFTQLKIQEKQVHPFEKQDTDQYFDLTRILKDVVIKESTLQSAKEHIEKNRIELEKVETGYYEGVSGMYVIVKGTYRNRNDLRPIEIHMNQSQVVRHICYVAGCGYNNYYGYGKIELCQHELAVLLLFQEYQKTHSVGDYTDLNANKFLALFRRKRKGLPNEEEQTSSFFHLQPRLESMGDVLKLSFKVGMDKLYVIKDLRDFVDNVEGNKSMKLGTKNELDFAVTKVDKQDETAYQFIHGIIKDEKQQEQMHLKNYRYYVASENRTKDSILLFGDKLDRFYALYENQTIPYVNKYEETRNKMITLRKKPLKCKLSVEKYEKNNKFQGVEVKGKFPTCIEGNQAGYYIEDGYLNQFSKEEMDKMLPLMKLEKDGYISLTVGKNNLPEFYYKVLPMLEDCVEVEEHDAELIASHLPPEVKFAFYLDAEEGNVTCSIKAKYGDAEITLQELLTAENTGGYRDFEEEQRVMQEVTAIFPAVDYDKQYLHCNQDEDVIYHVLQNGVDRLLTLGEVHSTDRFKRLNIRNKLKVTVGVSVESDLLNLDIKSEDMTKEELLDVLNSYKKKKTYHRLKNGEFVNITDETVELLSEMFDNLHISLKEFVKGKMKIPAYRALYLDKMLEENNSVYTERDKNYKKLIKEFKTVDESDFEIPDSLKNVMRKYQIYGYKWMKTIAAYGFGGILADDMGLGKTLQMISVLQSAKEEGMQGCSLIVCPASLVYNWQEECRRFAPSLKTGVLAGNQKDRNAMLAESGKYDVLITSYDLLKRDIDLYESITFSFEILDEAQYIKNQTTAVSKAVKTIQCKGRFALTGTPIENRLSELWSIFDYLMPGYLYTYDTFKKNFENQIVKYKNETATLQLKKMVSPFILRRLKQDVLKDLPGKLEEIRYARFEEKQQELYDAQVVKLRDMVEKQDDDNFNRNKIKVLAEITKLRQICCDPHLFLEDYHNSSAKTEACLDLIQSAMEGNHKMLIFSQFTSMLSILEEKLEQEKIAYYKITGETKKEKRIELVNQFNQDETPVFLISLKAGGTGLNLTGADIVIHYDPWWNLAVQNQATDRAHRIGQTKTVSVYKLIMKDSIEEKIIKMQEQKKDLADEILNGEMGNISNMSKEELLELIG